MVHWDLQIGQKKCCTLFFLYLENWIFNLFLSTPNDWASLEGQKKVFCILFNLYLGPRAFHLIMGVDIRNKIWKKRKIWKIWDFWHSSVHFSCLALNIFKYTIWVKVHVLHITKFPTTLHILEYPILLILYISRIGYSMNTAHFLFLILYSIWSFEYIKPFLFTQAVIP